MTGWRWRRDGASLGDHARREVRGDDFGAAARERYRTRAGAGREVENALARPRRDGPRRRDAPQLVLPEAEHRVGAVVAGRDLIEHAAHARRVFAEVGAIGFGGHSSILGASSWASSGRRPVGAEPVLRGRLVERCLSCRHPPLEVEGHFFERGRPRRADTHTPRDALPTRRGHRCRHRGRDARQRRGPCRSRRVHHPPSGRPRRDRCRCACGGGASSTCAPNRPGRQERDVGEPSTLAVRPGRELDHPACWPNQSPTGRCPGTRTRAPSAGTRPICASGTTSGYRDRDVQPWRESRLER